MATITAQCIRPQWVRHGLNTPSPWCGPPDACRGSQQRRQHYPGVPAEDRAVRSGSSGSRASSPGCKLVWCVDGMIGRILYQGPWHRWAYPSQWCASFQVPDGGLSPSWS